MPPQLLRNRVMRLCCVVLALQFFVLIGGSVMLPLAMQSIGRADADAVALRLLPMSLSIPFGAFVAGRVMYHTARYREPILVGSALATLGMTGIAAVAAEPPLLTAVLMIVMGIGLGLTMPPSLVAAQTAVPHALVGVATSTQALFRTFGGAVGIAILTSVLFVQLSAIAQPGAASGGTILAALAGAEPDALRRVFRNTFAIAAAAAALSLAFATRLPPRSLRDDAQPTS